MRISDWSSDVCSSDLESDLILTAPARVIGRLAEVYGLRAVRPPILMEAFEVRQYWHARNKDDPPHRWLRQLLHKVLSARIDRKSVVKGKSVYVRVDLGGGRIINKKKNRRNNRK